MPSGQRAAARAGLSPDPHIGHTPSPSFRLMQPRPPLRPPGADPGADCGPPHAMPCTARAWGHKGWDRVARVLLVEHWDAVLAPVHVVLRMCLQQ